MLDYIKRVPLFARLNEYQQNALAHPHASHSRFRGKTNLGHLPFRLQVGSGQAALDGSCSNSSLLNGLINDTVCKLPGSLFPLPDAVR